MKISKFSQIIVCFQTFGIEAERCNDHPCDPEPLWSEWGPCSATCGTAFKTRTKTCKIDNGKECEGGFQHLPCNLKPCPEYSPWGQWSPCSVTCGTTIGSKLRVRVCKNGNCKEELYQKKDCESGKNCIKQCNPMETSIGMKLRCTDENQADSVCRVYCMKGYNLVDSDADVSRCQCELKGCNWTHSLSKCKIKHAPEAASLGISLQKELKPTTTETTTTTTAATTTTSQPENVCKPFADPNHGKIECSKGVREGSICELSCGEGWTTNGGRSALCKCGKRSCWWTSTNLGYCSQEESYNDEAGQEELQEEANDYRDDCPQVPQVNGGSLDCTKGRQIFSVCKLSCDKGYEETKRKNIMRCRCANKYGQSPSKCSWRGRVGDCKRELYADYIEGAGEEIEVRKLGGFYLEDNNINDNDGIDSNTNQCDHISEHLGFKNGSLKHGKVDCTDYGVCTVSCDNSYYRKGPMEYYCKCAYNADKGCFWRPKRSVQCLPYRDDNN